MGNLGAKVQISPEKEVFEFFDKITKNSRIFKNSSPKLLKVTEKRLKKSGLVPCGLRSMPCSSGVGW